jgi:hypothetical protein
MKIKTTTKKTKKQQPKKHILIFAAENYCRNGVRISVKPWCYTTNPAFNNNHSLTLKAKLYAARYKLDIQPNLPMRLPLLSSHMY